MRTRRRTRAIGSSFSIARRTWGTARRGVLCGTHHCSLFSFEKHAHFERNDLRHQNHLFLLLFSRGSGGGETLNARELKAQFLCEESNHISPDKISNLRRINTTRTMTSSFAKLRRRVLLLLLVYSAFIFSASSS